MSDDARLQAALGRNLPTLDGLRGLAIAGVVACHFLNAWPGATALDRAAVGALGLGWAGVDLFFVLSGFLITGILVDTVGSAGWWRSFLIRRALRIFPLYYLALALFGLAGPALGLTDRWTFGRWGFWYWAYLGNWAYPAQQVIPALSHLWSLGVEEQFYLAWPLAVWAARGRRLAQAAFPWRRLAILAAALFLSGPLVRAAIVACSGWPVGSAFRVTPGRLDTLALGALLAVLLRGPVGRAAVMAAWPWAAALGAAGFLALGLPLGMDMHHPALEIGSHTFLALGFGGLLAGAVAVDGTGHPLARALSAPALGFLGRVSYGIYVLHYPLHVGALRALRAHPATAALLQTRAGYLAYAVAGAAASVGLAWLSWRHFERGFLALKDRWAPRVGGHSTRIASTGSSRDARAAG